MGTYFFSFMQSYQIAADEITKKKYNSDNTGPSVGFHDKTTIESNIDPTSAENLKIFEAKTKLLNTYIRSIDVKFQVYNFHEKYPDERKKEFFNLFDKIEQEGRKSPQKLENFISLLDIELEKFENSQLEMKSRRKAIKRKAFELQVIEN